MKTPIFTLTAFLFLAVQAVPSAAERWECKFKQPKGKFGIPTVLILQKNGADFLQADEISLGFNEGPVEVKETRSNEKKRRFRWRYKIRTTDKQTMAIVYNMTIEKDGSGDAFISAKLAENRSSFKGRGTCVEKPIDQDFLKRFNALWREKQKETN